MNENKIMTTRELSDYLKLNEKTIIKMAQMGKLPGVKIGNQWRFHLKAIESFLLKNLSGSSDEELDSVIKTDIDIIPLSRLTSHKLIEFDSASVDADGILKRLVEIVCAEGLTSSRERLFDELKKREKILSTAIGNSIAIPHARHPSKDLFREPRVVILLSKEGIDFDAPDKKNVHIFFMPCAPDKHTHIRLLARIAKFFYIPDIAKNMMLAESKDTVIQLLLNFDRAYMYATV